MIRAMARSPLWLLLLGLAVSLLFLGLLLASTDGHFVPPVVDLYLICQYAKAMAEGHPFQYNAGEPGSTGATSLLHTVLLAMGHAVGARGEWLVAFAVALGIAFFLATLFLARRIGRALGGEATGNVAAALVALNGPVAWGFLYGSDIALFMLLGTWLFDQLLHAESSGNWSGVAVVGVLLGLSRPEGLPVALLLLVLALRSPDGRRRPALALAPLAAAAFVLVLYKLTTGAWLGTSVADKSLFANHGLVSSLALCAQYGVDVIRGMLLGFYPSEAPVGFSRGWAPFYFPPLALLLVIAFAGGGARRRPAGQWLLIVAVLWLLVTPNVFMGVHYNRYLMWAFPGLLCLTAGGLDLVTRAIGNEKAARSAFRALAALALVLGALSVVRFAALYAEAAGEVWRRDVATAQWIAKTLPPGVAIANVATSVEYLTGHRNLNLHGVTSPAFFGNRTAEREAGLFEALGRLPVEARPALFLSSVSSQAGSPTLRELAPGPPLFQSSSLADELLVLRIDYALVGKDARMFGRDAKGAVGGLEEVDRLNVCDSQDERAHGYAHSSKLGNVALFGTVRIDTYPPAADTPEEKVADAGRVIFGFEEFDVRTRPGRELLVVMRTAGSAQAGAMGVASGVHELEVPEAGFVVTANGKPAGQVIHRPAPGWNELSFRVPAALVTADKTRLRLRGRYVSHQFWFFQ